MMVGTEVISEFIDSVIHTGFLANDKPLSAMLIAAPESGKTSVVENKECRSVTVVSDMIGSGLIEELSTKPHLRHIVINDMVAVMAHKDVTNQRTFAIMNMLSEEGLEKVMLPGGLAVNFFKRQVGFICCIPAELAKDNRRWWNSSGFASRFLPFNYMYSEDLILQIKKTMIISGVYHSKNGIQPLTTPTKRYPINIPENLAIQIQAVADVVAKTMGEIGLRRGKQLRALVSGHALLKGRKEVNEEDISFLKSLSKHFNYFISNELEYGKGEPIGISSSKISAKHANTRKRSK